MPTPSPGCLSTPVLRDEDVAHRAVVPGRSEFGEQVEADDRPLAAGRTEPLRSRARTGRDSRYRASISPRATRFGQVLMSATTTSKSIAARRRRRGSYRASADQRSTPTCPETVV